jgi:hypothetical protein
MGLPTVVIASEDFEELARSSAQALGLPEARILTVAHPIGGVADEILRRRAESSVELLMSLLGANVPAKDGK